MSPFTYFIELGISTTLAFTVLVFTEGYSFECFLLHDKADLEFKMITSLTY